MRPKYRYVRFEVISEKPPSKDEILEEIQKSILRTYGFTGLSEVMPSLVSFDSLKKEGVLRCVRARVIEMRASLAMISNINGDEAAFHVTRVSGSLRALGVH